MPYTLKNHHCTLEALQIINSPFSQPHSQPISPTLFSPSALLVPSASYCITLSLTHTNTFLLVLYKLLFLIHFFPITFQIINSCLHMSFPVQQSIVYHRQATSLSCRSAFEGSGKRVIFLFFLPVIFESEDKWQEVFSVVCLNLRYKVKLTFPQTFPSLFYQCSGFSLRSGHCPKNLFWVEQDGLCAVLQAAP